MENPSNRLSNQRRAEAVAARAKLAERGCKMMKYAPDPADLFIATATCQPISRVCRPEIDIQKRVGGSSFPLRFVAAGDEEIVPRDYATGSIFDNDPLNILLAIEAAESAIEASDFFQRLEIADYWEIDTSIIAGKNKITRRRAQQIKAQKIALADAGQIGFEFGEGEDE